MDPILDRVMKALVGLRRDRPADFAALKPEEIDAYIREETQGKYGVEDVAGRSLENVMTSVGQGLTFNFGDELRGLVKGPKARDEMRLRQELFHKLHPKTDIAGQLAGGILHFLLAPEAKGASLAGQIARGGEIGSISGAASGAGAGEDAQSRKQGALVGGVVGGVAGTAIPAVLGGLKYMVNPKLAADARNAAAVRKSGGADALRKTLKDYVDKGRGDVVMAGDLSPQLRAAADFSANNSDDTFVGLTQKLAARQDDASDRLLQDMRTLLGSEPNAAEQQAALEQSRRAFAAGPEGYGGLRALGSQFDMSPLKAAMEVPEVQSAWRAARLAGDLKETDPLNQLLAQPERATSFDDLQQLVRLLHGRAQVAWRQGNGALGESYGVIRDAVKDALEQGAPGYKAVNAEFAARKGLEKALKAGEEAWDETDSRTLARTIAGFNTGEREQFRLGMASRMISKLRSAATNRDEATKIVHASPTYKDKLKVVFGDEPTFDAFMERAKAEAELHKLNSAVSNSATARRLQSAGVTPGELGVDAISSGLSGGLASAALRGAGKLTKGAMVRGTAREMGPALLAQGSPAIEEWLRRVGFARPLLGALAARAFPAAAGRVPSLFEP